MTVAVFSDIHGSIEATNAIVDICHNIQADRVVICGDIYGWGADNNMAVGKLLSSISNLAVVAGNNDSVHYEKWSNFVYRDSVHMHIAGHNYMFTHGHRYNGGKLPPILGSGDVLVHGHTHVGRLYNSMDIHIANVGSVSQPRAGVKCYMTIVDNVISLHDMQGQILQTMTV